MGCREADKCLGVKHGAVRGAIERGEMVPLRLPGYARSYATPRMLAKWVQDYVMTVPA